MIRRAATVIALALLGGCAVGPDSHAPLAPVVPGYRAGPDGAGLELAPQGAIAADWWQALQSPALNRLIAHGLANSPDIATAQARLRSAQAQLRSGYGALFPQITAEGSADRARYSESRFGQSGPAQVFSLFTPGVAVGYVIDLFGGNRRMVEGLRANAAAQAETLRATRLALAGNIAAAAVARAAFHQQVEAWQAIVAAQHLQWQAARAHSAAGTQPLAAELASTAALDSALANLAAARVRAEQADDQLAVLVGDPPALAQLPALTLADFALPAQLPQRLPADMVRQRPDIRIAEAQAHAASAQIGVASAAMLPQITLSAGTGSSTNSFAALFGPGTGVWSLGAGIAAPLFDGGTLINRRNAARADYQAALAQWRKTVIAAFGQVADVLTSTAGDRAADAVAADAAASSDRAEALARVNYQAGLVSGADLATATIAAQTARIAADSARSAHVQDVIALYVALGGADQTKP